MKNIRPYIFVELKRILPEDAQELMDQTDLIYATLEKDIALAKCSSNPLDDRMVFAAYFLALIKVLEKKGYEYAFVEELCIAIAKRYVMPKNKLEAFLKRLPVLLLKMGLAKSIIKKMNKKTVTLGYEGGFRARFVTDKEETFGIGYGIDILECGIYKLYKKHGEGDKVNILCGVDRITSSLAGLNLVRAGTIAEGHNCCDFRFTYKNN